MNERKTKQKDLMTKLLLYIEMRIFYVSVIALNSHVLLGSEIDG